MSELERLIQDVLFERGLMLSAHVVSAGGCWAAYPHWEHADRNFIFPAANDRNNSGDKNYHP